MLKTACTLALLFAALLAFTAWQANDTTALAEEAEDDGFVSLFNGKDLTGWSPKIVGYELGEDPLDTFRVKEGVIQVRYDKYESFKNADKKNQFGHLFLDKVDYSHYILRLEYRFIGEKQVDGHPGGWAFRNSGVMIHGEDPKAMPKNKDFPDSIEVQLLGQDPNVDKPRSTANICSPGTHYFKDGKAVKRHCNNSSSKTFPGDQWVQLEIEAHGGEKIIHRVNGEVVFEYEKPTHDKNGLLTGGSISLQSESHALDFRNIEIKVLEE